MLLNKIILGGIMDTNIRVNDIVGKTIVSEQTGRKFGEVSDITFISDTGELMNLLLSNPTKHTAELQLQEDEKSRFLIPFSAVKSVGDFIIVTEKEIF